MTSAIVFAYSEVGYRCLRVVLAHGINVRFVATHQSDPNETMWFGSVLALAHERGIEVLTPSNANDEHTLRQVQAAAPDFIFSFYYRNLLCEAILNAAKRGALNMHGSLLPKYRGRAPVNWAIINGETQTGASLHYMVAKPDAGPLVGQEAVEIGINDTALDVSLKVAHAAENVLDRYLPALIAGNAPRIALDLSRGSYFGRRSAADGQVSWDRTAKQIHDLIRAVAPPFPGAFALVHGERLRLLGSHFANEPARFADLSPCLYFENSHLFLDCIDGCRIAITSAEMHGAPVTERVLQRQFGSLPAQLMPITREVLI
jgi:methionyl-tRNA formyltransferase